MVPDCRFVLRLVVVCLCLNQLHGEASDHADPIDPFNKSRQEGGLTGLFVFPVLADGKPAFPFQRSANLPLHDQLADVVRQPLTSEQQSQIKSIVFILCLHRALSDVDALNLEPYTYRIHIDRHTSVVFPDAPSAPADADERRSTNAATEHSHGFSVVEAYARYGGSIPDPSAIRPDHTMEFRLTRDREFQEGYPVWPAWSEPPDVRKGVFDDPFHFPMFFGTNVYAIAINVPIENFPEDRSDYLVWATSHKGSRQIDHVGRSGRTQSPRFEMLNTLEPRHHVAAILAEHEQPSLPRDIALRLNLSSLFAYRKWDFAPDVVCFSTKYPAGFPNGRLLTDDVAAILAQHGDTLLYELSYQDNNYRWPRVQSDARPFGETLPYLQPKISDPPIRAPPRLSSSSIFKLVLIAVVLLLLLTLTHVAFAVWYHRRKSRRRYL